MSKYSSLCSVLLRNPDQSATTAAPPAPSLPIRVTVILLVTELGIIPNALLGNALLPLILRVEYLIDKNGCRQILTTNLTE